MANNALTQLPYNAIRIRGGGPSGNVHYGTGFIYGFEDGDDATPVIVSNKHVLCGMEWLEFDFAEADDTGERIFGPATVLRLAAGDLPIIEHPDADVDLAVTPLIPMIQSLRQQGRKPHYLMVGRRHFAPPDIQESLLASSSILMVGFPNGLMDEKNNLPVVRRGHLATPYNADYDGKPNFVADIAAFGGSSGSPVFAFFEHTMRDEKGNISLLSEPRAYLIGVLHSGPIMTAQGIVPIPIPTAHLVSETKVMLHLGYCVKAEQIEAIKTVVQSLAPK